MTTQRKSLRQKKPCQEPSKSMPSRTPDTTLGSLNLTISKQESAWNVERLTTNYIPDEMVCRDEEKQVISNFI